MESGRNGGWTLVRTVSTIAVLTVCTTVAGMVLIGLTVWGNVATGAIVGAVSGVVLGLIMVLPVAVSSRRPRRAHDEGWQGEPAEKEMTHPNPPGGAGGRG